MPITGTNQNKETTVTASLETKVGDTITWDQAEGTWDENEGTWDNPEFGGALESKNSAISANLENKN